jgi:predicted deacylase
MNNSLIFYLLLLICFISCLITNYTNQIKHFIINSGNPGPTLLLIAGTHGNEPAGSVALENFINSNSSISKGKIIIIPRVNKIGLAMDVRWGSGIYPSNTELAKKIGNEILINLNKNITDENKKFTIKFTSPLHKTL